ncbi:General transcription factor 3C polypeptide 5 [Nymphon striatum]|nr:General transcription factor 3C polypeptide 5 [Nymphon striatum]
MHSSHKPIMLISCSNLLAMLGEIISNYLKNGKKSKKFWIMDSFIYIVLSLCSQHSSKSFPNNLCSLPVPRSHLASKYPRPPRPRQAYHEEKVLEHWSAVGGLLKDHTCCFVLAKAKTYRKSPPSKCDYYINNIIVSNPLGQEICTLDQVDRYSYLGLRIVIVLEAEGFVTFEKMTNMDFRGNIYYTINNLSLYECHGWCQQEPECKAARFSFVVNPITPVQQTKCEMQNETEAARPNSGLPRKTVNVYYFNKVHIRSEKVCKKRLWAFERVPNMLLPNRDNAVFFIGSKDDCLTSCLNEQRFICRSVEYNYKTRQCQLSNSDRRTAGISVGLQASSGTDYFENACIKSNEQCSGGIRGKLFKTPLFGTSVSSRVASSEQCKTSCNRVEEAFACRSFLFKPNVRPLEANCYLYHVDHHILPDGADTFTTPAPPPLLDDGGSIGQYFEASCVDPGFEHTSPTVQAQEKTDPSPHPHTYPSTYPPTNPTQPIISEGTSNPTCDSSGVCYDVVVSCENTGITVNVKTNQPFNGRIYALGRSETCNKGIQNGQQFNLRMSLSGQDCNTQSLGGVYSNTVVGTTPQCGHDQNRQGVQFEMHILIDPDSMYITSAPEAPMPRIIILSANGREASTVRIGDRLTFRIEIPDNTPYGIFARSCYAMAKDSRTSFKIVDDMGCPVDSGIFPRFLAVGSGLQSSYEAFRFTESYGVIFQCNVKYCIGTCEPAVCNLGRENVEAWGRKKRSTIEKDVSDLEDMTLSQEILVLDFGDENPGALTDRNFNTTRVKLKRRINCGAGERKHIQRSRNCEGVRWSLPHQNIGVGTKRDLCVTIGRLHHNPHVPILQERVTETFPLIKVKFQEEIMSEIPLNVDRKFVCVEYPAVVKNKEKMLTTLGGLSNVTKTHNDPRQRLQLSFHPDNPFCQSARGDREKSCAFLLRVRRKKVRNSPDTSSKPDNEVSAEIIGIVPTTYKFKNVFDFQYLPMTSSGVSRKSNLDNFFPNSIKTDSTFFKSPASLFIMPPIFSRLETPQNYQFRRQPISRDETGQENPLNVISKYRKFRGSCFKSWKFEDDVPLNADPHSVEVINKDVLKNDRENVIEKFEARPIWSRNALLAILKIDRTKLKIILPALAYYVITGPWRGLWIKFGYDPKKHPEAKSWQTVDFRTRQRNESFAFPSGEKVLGADDEELGYKFKSGRVPPFRQMLYQLCDIEIDEVQKSIEQDKPEEPDICHSRTGWSSSGFLANCRNLMNKTIEQHMEQLSSADTKKDSESESDHTADTEENEDSDDGYENVMESEMLEFI